MSTLSAQELHEQGVRYYYGDGVEADEKKAIECFEQAIKLGNLPQSKRSLGHILLSIEMDHSQINGPSDWKALQDEINQHKRGEQLIVEAAAEGDTLAQKWCIERYDHPLFIPFLVHIPKLRFSLYAETRKKCKMARKYKKQLLEAGDFDMLYNKAFSGLLPNKKIIEELANKEYAPAEYTLGAWYTEDYPYKKDLEKAKYWLTRAVEHGSEPAKEKLSKL